MSWITQALALVTIIIIIIIVTGRTSPGAPLKNWGEELAWIPQTARATQVAALHQSADLCRLSGRPRRV